MSITHASPVRTNLADTVCTSAVGSNGKLVIYSGTPPANADAALAGNVAIATITNVNFGAASGAGVTTIASSTPDPSAVGGIASFFRVQTSAGVTVFQGTIGTSGADATINSTLIAASAIVSLTGSNTYTSSP